MRWKLGTTAYKRVPSQDAAMDPDLETPDPVAEKTPDGGGGAGAAGPSRRRSLPHVCVAMVTSFLFGYHTGVVSEPLESISTNLGGCGASLSPLMTRFGIATRFNATSSAVSEAAAANAASGVVHAVPQTEPVVSAEWLHANLRDPDVKL